MFQPLTALPDDLRAHLRVPEELFNVQTRIFGRYHVRDPLRFFQSDDLWTVPQAQGSTQSLPNEAYYVIMRMPGEPEAEFLLLQPMVPLNRPNMIAWVAARQDAPNYGATRVYRFPADTTIFGPAQIEARIVQDPQISQQFTLWSQGGSTVIQGNLIVVPVGDSLIYLQPVYLQSQQSAFPEFQRIIVASPREVVWGETLAEALDLLLEAEGSGGPGPSRAARRPRRRRRPASPTGPTPTVEPGDPLPTDVPGLIEYANRHFELAQAALRDGDFARYGEEQRQGRCRPAAAPRARPGAGARVARALGQPRAMTVGATLVASLLVALARPATWPLALADVPDPRRVRAGARSDRRAADRRRTGQPPGAGAHDAVLPRRHADDRRAAGRRSRRVLCWLLVGGLVAAAAETEVVRRVAADDEVVARTWRRRLVPAAHPTRRRAPRPAGVVPAAPAGRIALERVPVRARRRIDELTVPSAGGLPLPSGSRSGLRRRSRCWSWPGCSARSSGRWPPAAWSLRGRRALGALGRALGRLARRPDAAPGPERRAPGAARPRPGRRGGGRIGHLGRASGGAVDRRRPAARVVSCSWSWSRCLPAGLRAGRRSPRPWRAAIWTVDVAGTFGGTVHGPEGQWNAAVDSGTLADLRPRGVDPDTR